MPQPIFHLYLAERPAVLDVADIWNNDVRNAFLHGAVAPDVGFFPGGERQLSHLAHHARTADMCRALLAIAESPVERAFAYGWLTHVLADALLHPLINEWCARQLGAGASAEDLLRLHVQLELGMDVLHVTTVRREGVPSFQSTFDQDSIAFLARAYRQVYGIEVRPRSLLDQHDNLARLTRQLLELELIMAGATRDGLGAMPQKMVLQTLRTVAAVSSGARSLVTAFLHPIYPEMELALRLKTRLETFDRWFYRSVATDLHDLQNVDLDTGLPITDATGSAVA